MIRGIPPSNTGEGLGPHAYMTNNNMHLVRIVEWEDRDDHLAPFVTSAVTGFQSGAWELLLCLLTSLILMRCNVSSVFWGGDLWRENTHQASQSCLFAQSKKQNQSWMLGCIDNFAMVKCC